MVADTRDDETFYVVWLEYLSGLVDGTAPTVTDTNVVLGYLNPRHLLGGAGLALLLLVAAAPARPDRGGLR